MHLSALTYQTFWDGTLGVEAKVGAEEAPSFSPSDLVSLVQFVGKLWPLRRFQLDQTEHQLVDQNDKAALVGIRTLVEQFTVVTTGQHWPTLPFEPQLFTEVDSSPWLHFPTTFLIYNLDETRKPQLSERERGQLVFKFVRASTPRLAYEWIKEQPVSDWKLWNVWPMRRPAIQQDLSKLDFKEMR